MHRHRCRPLGGLALAILLIAGTACGSRLDEAQIAAAHNGSVSTEGASSGGVVPDQAAGTGGAVDAGATTSAETGASDSGATAGAAVPGSAVGPGQARVGAGPSAAVAPGQARARAGSGAASAGSAAAAPGGTPGTPGGGAAAAKSAGNAPTPGAPSDAGPVGQPQGGGPASGTPILVGFVGTTSGIVGATVGPGLPAVRAWVASVNASGGIKGHPVKLFAADDGADPSRHRRLVQELVERDKVIAFPFMAAPLSGHGGIDYITQKRIPVTGDSGASTWYYSSPMYFPQMSSGSPWILSMIHAVAADTVPQGKTKLAMLNCQEAQFCVDADRLWPEEAPKVGFEVVFRRQASIAQPDYTAECLGARNAGADVFAVAMDNASVSRVGSSCARVGYHPVYFIHHSGHAVDQARDPNLDGMLVPLATRAWFDTSSPAVAAYQKALDTHTPGATSQPVALAGWTGSKLFELAATRAPDPTTSEGILEGLWSLNGETLGDLTLPLKFNRNQNASPIGCWFMIRANKAKWEYTQGGNTLRCMK